MARLSACGRSCRGSDISTEVSAIRKEACVVFLEQLRNLPSNGELCWRFAAHRQETHPGPSPEFMPDDGFNQQNQKLDVYC